MRVAVFGSCVTRDLFEDPAIRGLLGSYTARSSIISVVAPPVSIDADRLTLPSPWQHRSVIADFRKTFQASLASERPDWLVIDLIDERFDLLRIGDSLVTNSSALQAADTQGQHPDAELVKRMSSEGRELFHSAAELFVGQITEIVPPERIILHRALWCPRYRAGDTVRSFDERRVKLSLSQNGMLNEGYDALRDRLGESAREVAVDPKIHLADEQHRWKLEPFHYDSGYNQLAVRRLRDAFEV